LKTDFLNGLAAFNSAIAAARRSLVKRPEDSVASLRRIARVMLGVPAVCDSPELAKACHAVVGADTAKLPELVATLAEIATRICAELPFERVVVLIVDDDPVIGHLLKVRLKSATREILVAGTAAEAFEIIHHRLISLVILDLGLPDRDGRDVLAEIRLSGTGAALPVLVLSAVEDPHIKTECFALGADEYFEKPVDIEMLTTAVSAKLQRIAEINRKLGHDPLTGALNRLSFSEMFVRNSALMSRTEDSLTIALLDLDHFKSVNDTYGHAMGDDVLCRVTEVLEQGLRKSDSFGRWGGEEFVVLFPGTDGKGAVRSLQKIADDLRKIEFNPDSRKFNVTFSAGVSQIVPGTPVQAAVAAADIQLYKAKNTGRNRIVLQP